MPYDPVPKAERDPSTRGRRCQNCGRPGFDHSLRRTGDGQDASLVGYTMECPDVDPADVPMPGGDDD